LAREVGEEDEGELSLSALREGKSTILQAEAGGETVQFLPPQVKSLDDDGEKDFLQGLKALWDANVIDENEYMAGIRSFRAGPQQGQKVLKSLASGQVVVQDASGNITVITPDGLQTPVETKVVGGSLVWIDPDTQEARFFTPPPTAKQGEILMIKQAIGTGDFGFTEFGKVPFMVVGGELKRMVVPGLDAQPTPTTPPQKGLTILERITAAVKGTKKK